MKRPACVLIGLAWVLFGLFGTAAKADWTGHWIGKGTITFSNGKVTACNPMETEMELVRDRYGHQSLRLFPGFPACDQPSDLDGLMSLQVVRGTVFLENESLGTLTDSRIQLLHYSRVGFKEWIEMEMGADGVIHYRKAFSSYRTGKQFEITGTLERVLE